MIGEPRYVLRRLAAHHDRAVFTNSTEPALEAYLRDDARAKRENDRNVTAVYVLLDTEADEKIAGYFTLSNAVVVPSDVPPAIARRLPRYDNWGCVRLGRMARDDAYEGRRLGTVLVARAFVMALRIAAVSGSLALLVDAKNDRLVAWYQSLGFTPFEDRPRTLFIMNGTMAAYVERVSDRGDRAR